MQASLAEVLRVAGVRVIGTAGDPAAARRLVESLAPDALVIDPRLPDLDAGLGLISSLRRDWPQLRVVLMGWSDNGEAQIPTGVAAYIAKSAEPEEFVAATLAACNG